METSLTHENFNPLGFRLNENAAIRGRAAGRLAAQKYPEIRHWSGITTDNEAGASQWRAFAAGIKRYYPEIAGKEPVIIDVIKVKVGANDFKNEISQIMAGPVEGLMLSFPDPATLVQQARPFGWERKIKVFMDMGNDVVLANALGKRTPPNFWTASDWYSGAYVDRVPAAKRLYDDYVARTGDDRPSGYVGISHAAINVYVQAIAKAGAASTNAVAKALEQNSFDTVGGKRSFRSDHQATGDLNFYNFVASDTDRRGWSVAQFVAEDNSSVAPPPRRASSLWNNCGQGHHDGIDHALRGLLATHRRRRVHRPECHHRRGCGDRGRQLDLVWRRPARRLQPDPCRCGLEHSGQLRRPCGRPAGGHLHRRQRAHWPYGHDPWLPHRVRDLSSACRP